MAEENLELPDAEVGTEITPTGELLELLKKELAKLFAHDDRINLGSQENNYNKAGQILDKCVKGWTQAPKTFKQRLIMCISSFGPRQNRVGSDGASKIIEEAFSRVVPLVDITDTAETDLEKQFIEERLKKYLNEYEFNESSDMALLRQLVSTEYVAWRLEFAQRQDWKHPQKYSSALQNIENRMMKLMERLGVARFQREDADSQALSSLAELAQSLDSKMAKQKEITEQEFKERNKFIELREKQGRQEVNVIPASEYDALEKKMAEQEKIDPDKYFDASDMDIDQFEQVVSDG